MSRTRLPLAILLVSYLRIEMITVGIITLCVLLDDVIRGKGF